MSRKPYDKDLDAQEPTRHYRKDPSVDNLVDHMLEEFDPRHVGGGVWKWTIDSDLRDGIRTMAREKGGQLILDYVLDRFKSMKEKDRHDVDIMASSLVSFLYREGGSYSSIDYSDFTFTHPLHIGASLKGTEERPLRLEVTVPPAEDIWMSYYVGNGSENCEFIVHGEATNLFTGAEHCKAYLDTIPIIWGQGKECEYYLGNTRLVTGLEGTVNDIAGGVCIIGGEHKRQTTVGRDFFVKGNRLYLKQKGSWREVRP